MTSDTYWKIRAFGLKVALAHAQLHETTEQYHALLEANGLPIDRPLDFDDLRHIITEQGHGVPDRDR